MPEPTRLYRSDSYPYSISEDVELERYIDTESGAYLLTVLDEDGNFKLELPTGEDGKYDSITDSFNEFMDRAPLYKRLDEGVYEFIQETMKELETLNVKEKPEGKEIVMTMNTERYVLTVYPTGMCKLEYPSKERAFYIDDLYLECLDLAVLYDGRLAQHFTEKVKKELGIQLPKAPILPMLKVE